ncbi:hypothetical protein ACQKQD_33670 [Methylobacterium sp. NPDC080182]|uniref:hypothetical protein n=1 Tax=Methylobacterium sp. NPDC080182 TaxID=3390590 RepID=UPI003D043ECD
MPNPTKIEGKGTSLEEAIKDALDKVPQQAGADILVALTVEKFGIRAGGFAGISEFWVEATYKLG